SLDALSLLPQAPSSNAVSPRIARRPAKPVMSERLSVIGGPSSPRTATMSMERPPIARASQILNRWQRKYKALGVRHRPARLRAAVVCGAAGREDQAEGAAAAARRGRPPPITGRLSTPAGRHASA